MIFHRNLSDIKSPQVSGTLRSILADFNNSLVWIVPACPSISNFDSPFSKPSETIPSTPITFVVTFVLMFQSFHSFLARSPNLSLFFAFFHFHFHQDDMSDFFSESSLGLVFRPKFTNLLVPHSPGLILICTCTLIVWSNFSFLHNS